MNMKKGFARGLLEGLAAGLVTWALAVALWHAERVEARAVHITAPAAMSAVWIAPVGVVATVSGVY